MAKTVIGPNSTFKLNGTDVSQFVTDGAVQDDIDPVEVTGWSETYKEYLGGLRDSTITATFVNDYSATGPHTLITAMRTTAGTVKVNPDTSGTIVFTMVAKAYSYSPVAGGVGAANTTQVTFMNAGTAGMTQGTA